MTTKDQRVPGPNKTSTKYELYIQLDTLLALQHSEEEQLHPDDLIFQVVHQTFELWWKVTLQFLHRAVVCLQQEELEEAAILLHRAATVQTMLLQVMQQLEFLSPLDFLTLRDGLGNGSGASSPGFRAIKQFAPTLWQAFLDAISHRQTTLVEIYRAPKHYREFYQCSERMVDFDEQMYFFRSAHLKLAQRFLGVQAVGTGGYTIAMLEKTLQHMLFPALWELRSQLLT